jgi:hypothetical protein
MDRRNAVILVPRVNAGLAGTVGQSTARHLIHGLANALESVSFDLVLPVLNSQSREKEKALLYSWIQESPSSNGEPSGDCPGAFGDEPPVRVVALDGEDRAEIWRQMVLFAFEDGYERAILLRPDSLELRSDWMDAAFGRLGHEVEVLIATSRGGDIAAIGVDGVYLELFRDIPWGTPMVASVMEERARAWHLAIEVTGPFGLANEVAD